MYCLLRWAWELLFSEEALAVLPRCVAGTMMAAAWGEKGRAVLPAAAGLWRSVTGVTWTLAP